MKTLTMQKTIRSTELKYVLVMNQKALLVCNAVVPIESIHIQSLQIQRIYTWFESVWVDSHLLKHSVMIKTPVKKDVNSCS